MDFNLDPKAASSYGRGSSYITSSGKYIGEFYRAESVTSKSGTQGVDLLFKTPQGEIADYMTIWHTKADGTRLPGFDAINALMTVLKVRGAKEGAHKAERWVKENKAYEPLMVRGYDEFCHKLIGIVLQETLEDDGKGGNRQGKQIIGFFEANTELTAAEILNKASKPEALAKQLTWLASHPIKDNRKNKSAGEFSKPSSSSFKSDAEDWDSDIPF